MQEEIQNPTELQVDRTEINALRLFKQNGFYGVTLPISVIIKGVVSNVQVPFFIANRPYQLVEVSARYKTSNGGVLTFQVEKVPSGIAPGSGTDLLTTPLNMNGTANTNQFAVIGDITMDTGDSLSLKSSTFITNLADLTISVLLRSI